MKPPMKSFCAMVLAGTALCAAGAVSAGETTVIHEYRHVVPDRPTVDMQAPQARSVTIQRTAVRKTAVRSHHATVRHVSRRTVTTHRTAAPSANTAAMNTSASTRTDATQDQDSYRQGMQTSASDDATVLERRTVIHRDDEGNVSRHTRVIRQGPDGMTSIEHRSSEGPDMAPETDR